MNISKKLTNAENSQKNMTGICIFSGVGSFFELKNLYEYKDLQSFGYLTVGMFLLALTMLMVTTFRIWKYRVELEDS